MHIASGFLPIFVPAAACSAPAGYYPATGYRLRSSGAMTSISAYGLAWTGSASMEIPNEAWAFRIEATAVWARETYADWNRADGFTVRCLQAFMLAIFGGNGTRRTRH